MNNNFKAILKRANLNFKSELIFVLIINAFLIGGMIAVYIFTHNNLFFIPFIFLIVLTNGISFYRYLFLYTKNITSRIKEFVSLFRYLYLDINNQIKVKTSLLSLKERASLNMNQMLEEFTEERNKDASLLPYLHFASHFSSVYVEEAMINLYRYDKHSHKENLQHFNDAYLRLKKEVEEEALRENNNQYEFIKATAIIGTALIVILVIVVTIIIVEEYIHG